MKKQRIKRTGGVYHVTYTPSSQAPSSYIRSVVFPASAYTLSGTTPSEPDMHYNYVKHTKIRYDIIESRGTDQVITITDPFSSVGCDAPALWAMHGLYGDSYDPDTFTEPIEREFSARILDSFEAKRPDGYSFLDDIRDRMFASMVPKIPQDVSILNFIYELKDIKRGLMDPWFTSKGNFLKKAASGHLDTTFNTLPFISDCCKIVKAISSVRQRVKVLLKNQHKVLIRRRKQLVHPDGFEAITGKAWPFLAEPVGVGLVPSESYLGNSTTTYSQGPIMVRCTMKYSYFIPEMSEFQANLRAICDAIGIALDPSIIWAAVPFSFIYDWFVSVQGYLHQLAKKNFPVFLRVHDYCISIKCDCSLRQIEDIPLIRIPQPGESSPTNRVAIRQKMTYYERTPSLPTERIVVQQGRPWSEISKILISLSLLVTNTKQAKFFFPKWKRQARAIGKGPRPRNSSRSVERRLAALKRGNKPWWKSY